MAELVWSESLRLNQPQMDHTHEEFVELLATARRAADADELPRALGAFKRLLEHTIGHFAQEERWMRATGFAAENCHSREHEMVLKVMHEVVRLINEESRWEPLRVFVGELALWFPQHAETMDAALAQHMAEFGFDPATGLTTKPLPEDPILHCGGHCH
ncbi:MAG TPA: hemerythrin domain-containing protein [Albitalea sp.]|nr:hemerythrin domain-containing protein [Albitalea sp.]